MIGVNLVFELKKENVVLDVIDEDVMVLEIVMDWMDVDLLELKYFILLGGYLVVFYVYVVRIICWRVECLVVVLV